LVAEGPSASMRPAPVSTRARRAQPPDQAASVLSDSPGAFLRHLHTPRGVTKQLRGHGARPGQCPNGSSRRGILGSRSILFAHGPSSSALAAKGKPGLPTPARPSAKCSRPGPTFGQGAVPRTSFAVLIDSGVRILRSLTADGNQQKKPLFRRSLEAIRPEHQARAKASKRCGMRQWPKGLLIVSVAMI